MNDDLYKILKVRPNASLDEIKATYKRLAQKFHPDKHKGDPDKENEFKKINAAYEILKNKEKRKLYDDTGATTVPDSIESKGVSMFIQQVNELIIQKPPIDRFSMRAPERNFSIVRDNIKKIIVQLNKNIQNLVTRILELKDMKQTIINKSDPLNLIKNKIDEIIDDLKISKDSKQVQIKVSEFAIEYCDHYELLGDTIQLNVDMRGLHEPDGIY